MGKFMIENNDISVLTPKGFMKFDGIRKCVSHVLKITFADDTSIRTTLDHRFQLNDGSFVFARELKPKCKIKNKQVVSIKYDVIDEVYDLVNVEGGNVYITNGCVSHNCSFIGSSFSLIDGKKISELPMLKGNQLFPDYIEYFPPDKSKSYVITVDTSRGSELDYSAFPIIDISTMPYKVVAVYRNNAISSLVYPEVIYRAGKRYNDAFVLIESNDLGQQVADILFYDLEYENVYMSVKDKVKEGGGSKKSPGLRTTKRTKAIGCSQLKDLIENDQLEVNDPEIISELSTFIRKGASYAADEGKHDDLAMCLVMFGYLVQEPIFKDLFDFSLRDMMIKNQLKELDDILDPIGFFDRGDDFVIPSDSYNQNGWTENTTDEWNF